MGGELRTEPAAAGVHGFDTNTRLTATTAKALSDAGFTFAVRYLSRKATPSSKDLTAEELEIILDAGLAVMAVQHVAPSGWTPSEALGVEYGGNAAMHARAIALPDGASVWLDLEGIAAGTSADATIAYCNAWFKEVESAGYTTGVYVGANSILSADELYLRLKTKHYWKSGSNVPAIPHRGYCMVQHIIAGDQVGGVEIDRNVTFVDAFGSSPMLVTRGPALAMAAAAAPPPAAPIERALAPAAKPEALAPGANGDEAILRDLAASHGLSVPMETLIRFRNGRGAPMKARYWAIANFDLRSSEPRLFLFDVGERRVQPFLCAHGKGSEGSTDDGYAEVFSDVVGSNCTSLGVYRCAETYEGKHGYSMRLDGLEPTNSNARGRAIVVHGASYVSPEFIAQSGRIGRSDGCLAVENRYVTEVVSALTGGSLVSAWSSKASKADGAKLTALDEGEVWSELEPPAAFFAAAVGETAASLARRIQQSPRIVLARKHSETPVDGATAFDNIADTADGRSAHRSTKPPAPGGVVALDPHMLSGMLALSETYRFSVSEFCGGVHSQNSRHYAGCAADINTIDGKAVSAGPAATAFRKRCRELGATEVLGPGDKGHSTHIHAAWPRP